MKKLGNILKQDQDEFSLEQLKIESPIKYEGSVETPTPMTSICLPKVDLHLVFDEQECEDQEMQG